MTGEDLESMVAMQTEAQATSIGLRDQAQAITSEVAEGVRLPKGLRTTAHILDCVSSVTTATRAIMELYMELGTDLFLQTIEDSRLLTTATITARQLQSHAPTLKQGLTDIETMIKEGYDRPAANLRCRIVKGQATTLMGAAELQAKALAAAINSCPLPDGALQLFCILQEKGNMSVNVAVEATLQIAGEPLMLVEDAPALLKAVQHNDQEAITAILRKSLERQA